VNVQDAAGEVFRDRRQLQEAGHADEVGLGSPARREDAAAELLA
jgi:hypothetical protein